MTSHLRGALAAIIADPDCCAASKAIARGALGASDKAHNPLVSDFAHSASKARIAELELALEMTTDLLERASRTMTEECKVALNGRRWGETRIAHSRALLARALTATDAGGE